MVDDVGFFKKLGAKIQLRRKDLGVTVQDLADLLNITAQQFAKYEKGDARIGVISLYTVCIELEITPNEILEDNDILEKSQEQKQIRKIVKLLNQISDVQVIKAFIKLLTSIKDGEIIEISNLENFTLNREGLNLIKKFEGFKPNVYICPAGKKTIGYGHKLFRGEKIMTVSEKDAESILKEDVRKAEKGVIKHVKVKLTENQFSALVSFTFNVGVTNFLESTLLRKINREKFDEVPEQLKRWVYATVDGKKTELKGLVARRKAECNLFMKEIRVILPIK